MLRKLKMLQRGLLGADHVELIKGGEPYFTLLLKLIREAKTIIHIQVYILEEDETGTLITQELIKAVRRNIQVYLLIDGYASQGLSNEFIENLRSPGIHFKYFEPLFRSS